MFNAFEDLFSPGRKHTRDEQNRLELTREDVGDNDPGRGPIDLASGKAVIRLPGETADADRPADTPPAGRAPDEEAPDERAPGGASADGAAPDRR
ncbi:DUF6191 domain-containing protein [Streptomyces sp. NPDC015171]|uniref:DUF6191 domain-containing protein n=1 Tax=Streptomyces sp. NPDC015171 TaxID=3364945 RepID=UPI0036FA36CF